MTLVEIITDGGEPVISGGKLRTLRNKKRLSLRRVAQELEISEAHMSRFETGASLPNLIHLNRLAQFYRVPIHYLLETDLTLEAIMVQGGVAAGRLIPDPIWPPQRWYPILVPPSRRHPGAERRGLQVETDDMDLLFPIGTTLVINDPPAVEEIADNTPVILLRTDEQGLVEQLCRELRREADGTVWLWPRSSNPRHQQPILYRPGGNPLTIVGVVTAIYREL